MTRRLQDKLTNDALNASGQGLLADAAFSVKGTLRGPIMTPLKEGDLEKVAVHILPGLVCLSAVIMSIRQFAELFVYGRCMDAIGKVYRILERKLRREGKDK